MFRVLNTLNLESCEDCLDAFKGIAVVDTLKDDYEVVLNNIEKYHGYLSALTVQIDKDILEKSKKSKSYRISKHRN